MVIYEESIRIENSMTPGAEVLEQRQNPSEQIFILEMNFNSPEQIDGVYLCLKMTEMARRSVGLK